MCGRKVFEDGHGVTWARWVQAHIDGHNPPWCWECFAVWWNEPPRTDLPSWQLGEAEGHITPGES